MTAVAAAVRLTQAEAAAILRGLGFRVDTGGQYLQAVRVFQDAFRLAPAQLRVDGIVGPQTSAALAIAALRLKAGQTTCSPHFGFSEFACRCQRRHPACRGVLVVGELVDALEKLRAAFYPGGLYLASAYRCPDHNADPTVGGAAQSQHLYGTAADVGQIIPTAKVATERIFSGVGYGSRSGKVRHVDVRHAGPNNTTGSSPDHPAEWVYNDS